MKNEIMYKEESYKFVGACFEVYNEIGPGFLEAVYQECLGLEFEAEAIPFEEKKDLSLHYKGTMLKQCYQPDFLCFQEIVLEIKAAKSLADDHRAQVINYLKATAKNLEFSLILAILQS